VTKTASVVTFVFIVPSFQRTRTLELVLGFKLLADPIAGRLEQSNLTPEHRAILARLALDTRMQKVWSELLKRDRPSGNFAYPALQRQYRHLRSKNHLQSAALSERSQSLMRSSGWSSRELARTSRSYRGAQ
jgi:hypothetical protein